jgi:hypothetical protein
LQQGGFCLRQLESYPFILLYMALQKWHSNSVATQTYVTRVPGRTEENVTAVKLQDFSKNDNTIVKENPTVISKQFESDEEAKHECSVTGITKPIK